MKIVTKIIEDVKSQFVKEDAFYYRMIVDLLMSEKLFLNDCIPVMELRAAVNKEIYTSL